MRCIGWAGGQAGRRSPCYTNGPTASNQFAVKYLFFSAKKGARSRWTGMAREGKEVIGGKKYIVLLAESATTYCSAITLVEIRRNSSVSTNILHFLKIYIVRRLMLHSCSLGLVRRVRQQVTVMAFREQSRGAVHGR